MTIDIMVIDTKLLKLEFQNCAYPHRNNAAIDLLRLKAVYATIHKDVTQRGILRNIHSRLKQLGQKPAISLGFLHHFIVGNTKNSGKTLLANPDMYKVIEETLNSYLVDEEIQELEKLATEMASEQGTSPSLPKEHIIYAGTGKFTPTPEQFKKLMEELGPLEQTALRNVWAETQKIQAEWQEDTVITMKQALQEAQEIVSAAAIAKLKSLARGEIVGFLNEHPKLGQTS